MPTWKFWRIASIPPIALASTLSLLVTTFWLTVVKAEPVDESVWVIMRQPILIDYAEDTALCRSLIHEATDYDDHFRTHYYLSLPPGVSADLFDDDVHPDSTWAQRYSHGRFDFDNDGVTDFVYAATQSTRFSNNDRYFIFPNHPKPGADLPEDEQPPYEPWPDNFSLEWLTTHSRYVFPDMWASSDTYTLRRQKTKNPIKYELQELYSTPFRLHGVTYLLLVPNSSKDLGALLRPKPNKTVEEACVFRRKGHS